MRGGAQRGVRDVKILKLAITVTSSPSRNLAINFAMMTLPKTYRHVVFGEKGSDLTIEETELKLLSPGEILIKVEACGVCY